MTRRPALASPVSTGFAIDGYRILPGLLSPTEVASVQQAVDRRLAAPQGASCERPNNTLVALRWDDPIVGTIAGDDVRMERLGTTVAADDLRWVSGYLSIKDPHSPPLWWHQDWWSWNHPVTYLRAPVQVALLCYTSDTDVGTGALRVVPGSHARSTALHAILPEAHSDESTGLDPAHAAMRDHDGQVTSNSGQGTRWSSTTDCCTARTRTVALVGVTACSCRLPRPGEDCPLTSGVT